MVDRELTASVNEDEVHATRRTRKNSRLRALADSHFPVPTLEIRRWYHTQNLTFVRRLERATRRTRPDFVLASNGRVMALSFGCQKKDIIFHHEIHPSST